MIVFVRIWRLSDLFVQIRLVDENAEELVTQTLVLNDPFDLENFEERRQGILIALTACSPKLVAP